MMDGWMDGIPPSKRGRKGGREEGFLGLQFTTLNFTIPRKNLLGVTFPPPWV